MWAVNLCDGDRRDAQQPGVFDLAGAKKTEKGEHQNVGRAALILDALANASRTGLRLTDIVSETGLGRTVVHRFLAGLVIHGLVDQDELSGRYFLGMKIVGWAAEAGNRYSLAQVSEPALRRLSDATQDSIYLMVRDRDEAVCVARQEGSYPIKTLTLKVGDRRPLGVGAGPLAILAYLQDEEIDRILHERRDERAPFGVDDVIVRELIVQAREAGYAAFQDLINEGMGAVAVPIRRKDGAPIASINVVAITSRMEPGRREFIAKSVRNEIDSLEKQLEPLLSPAAAARLAATG